jgi:uncharacterized membrane protein
MFRTVAVLAVVAVVGWIALKLVFGVAGGLIGVLISLAWLALKVLLFVGLVYWLLTVFSPETAQKLRNSVKL